MKKLSLEQLESRQLMHGAPVHTGPLPDVDGDGTVTASDISMVLGSWGTAGPRGDATGDGAVGSADLTSVIGAYGQQPHADDAAKHAEHTALMQLFNIRTTTAAVIHSGNWSDPLTWGGEVPAADAVVWVPAWYTLTVDGEVQAKHVRVDGQLSFAANSHLTVDTLVGSPTSHLDIDLPNADETARITFAGEAIDTTWDKFAISRGLVWHGSSDIMGAEKTTWAWMESARKGDTQLTVADATGWRVGDRLVIGGATVGNRAWEYLTPANDDVLIVAIDGNVVTLNKPLAFDHLAVASLDPVPVVQQVPVINMTRNIVFESASKDLNKRGHVMFMHNPDQHVAYAAFNDLGRTDKNDNATDPDGKGGGLANPRGRYSLHLHRTGIASQAVEVTGIAISGNPGWGLVNHDSNVNVDQAVSYNVLGAHFVTETGYERGSFTNSVAAYSKGTAHPKDPGGFRILNNDLGHDGVGFWLEGNAVTVDGCVAVGMNNTGFEFFARHEPFGPPMLDPFSLTNSVSLYSRHGAVTWEFRFPLNTFPNVLPAGTEFALIANNFLHSGVFLGYSGTIELRDNTLVGWNDVVAGSGIDHTGINANMRYIDNSVTNFSLGIQMPTEGDSNLLQGGYYDNRSVNIMVRNYLPDAKRLRTLDIIAPTFGTRAAANIDMSISSYLFSFAPTYNGGTPYGQHQGDLQSAIFGYSIKNLIWRPHHVTRLDGVPLYFAEQGADFEFGKLLTGLPASLRYEPDGVTLATGASLNARGLYVGGQALPAGEQYHLPGVKGVLVNAAT